ncbi:MAG: F0F1 ATP synthase subunit B [Verrucomicrobiales bacterium]|nr:F0F1 ATP synthase subunit B [Verrucomicrobiales bacterium]
MSVQLLADLSEIPRQLGIEWPKLIAQTITFMVVYWVLSKYAFGPVSQLLEQRRQRIAEGEENLKKIRTDLDAANATASEIRTKAEDDARRIVKEAQDAANAAREARTQEAVAEAASIVAKAREASQLERDRTFADLKNEFARLVVNTTSKVTGKVLSPDDHSRINDEALSQISK